MEKSKGYRTPLCFERSERRIGSAEGSETRDILRKRHCRSKESIITGRSAKVDRHGQCYERSD